MSAGVRLKALIGSPLADSGVREIVTSTAEALGERNGIRIKVTFVSDDAIELEVEGSQLNATAAAAELTEFVRPRVAKWWLPERWAFVTDIPLTSTGKFDKKKLRRQYADGDLTVETLA